MSSDIAKAIRKEFTSDNPLPVSGGGGSGGGGDASAANQQEEIAKLTSIDSKTTSDPATGSKQDEVKQLISDRTNTLGAKTAAQSIPVTLSSDGAFSTNFGSTTDTAATTDTGTFSFLAFVKRLLSVKLDIALSAISNKLPSALVSDRLKIDGSGVTQPISGAVTANLGTIGAVATETTIAAVNAKLPSALVSDRIKTNTVGAILNLSGSANAINTDVIASVDVSDFSWITLQLTGAWSAGIQVQFSNDGITFTNGGYYMINGNAIAFSSITLNTLYQIPKQGRFFRVRVTGYTSGTVAAIVQCSNNAPSSLPVQTVTFFSPQSVTLSSNTVDTEFSGAVALNESLTLPTSPAAIAAGYAYNGATWDRRRSAGNAAPGLGRSLVAPGTANLNLLTGVTAIGAGASNNLYSTYSNLTAQLIISGGTVSTISCAIEGSMTSSGVNWYNLATLTDPTNSSAVFIVSKCFLYVRANLTVLTGTSTPTISIIAGATP
ncbi:MAG: discoidin domain-containing protein [Tolypothrix brevis GSE-NOS-MK-07-07A]|jgi:hypothetical protein|nr:discoidin domain-containing protein [Tolypothrix brevis GSE-NOS-MK-07-07A]